ncbi:EF-hand domain-containing protein [Neorhizobium sp. NCHU2750]|uniref:EF-hand domain-containing protein n=1 Tax=Neorhizobium sp. NCHU2750 TaxID=1825976 RepID=UPI000E71EB61|nr:signal transduction protein [Neorhizobium sp. NCHU2750]
MMKRLNLIRVAGLRTGSAAALLLIAGHGALAADGNGSKEVTRAQFETRQQAVFFKADKDNNHLVSRDEFIAARPAGDPTKLGKRFDRMDANHDGSVDAGELTAMLDRRFKRLDKDGNGVLSVSERAAGRKQVDKPTDG